MLELSQHPPPRALGRQVQGGGHGYNLLLSFFDSTNMKSEPLGLALSSSSEEVDSSQLCEDEDGGGHLNESFHLRLTKKPLPRVQFTLLSSSILVLISFETFKSIHTKFNTPPPRRPHQFC